MIVKMMMAVLALGRLAQEAPPGALIAAALALVMVLATVGAFVDSPDDVVATLDALTRLITALAEVVWNRQS